MVTVNELTTFGGNEGEDASWWFRSFVTATRGDSESVLLRMFPTYLEADSPAQEWYYGLPYNARASWSTIDSEFRQRWVSRVGVQAKKGDGGNIETFQNHRLTDDDIFGPASVDITATKNVIVDWAEKQSRLGAATGLDDGALIQVTKSNLPAFLRAFLRYRSEPPTTFQMLCSRIKEIDDRTLEFEQLRHQEKNVELLSELVETVKRLHEATIGAQGSANASFPVPTKWKNTNISVDKAGMVKIVEEVLRTIRKYKPSEITIASARVIDVGLLYYYNAINSPAQFHPNSIMGQAGIKSNLWQGIFQINSQQAFNGVDDVAEAITIWESFTDLTPLVKSECIYKPNHIQYHWARDGGSYPLLADNAPHYGALAEIGNGSSFPFVGVTSAKTILYFLLSAQLAERVTESDKPFTQAAIDSANWIAKWNVDENTRLVKSYTHDMYKMHEWGNSSLSPDLTGLFIEGLCILAAVTGVDRWRSLAIDICDAAMQHRDWHDDEGMFSYVSRADNVDANAFRGLLTRGLLIAYQRNPENTNLRHKIRSYINVQFNGLRDSAHVCGSHGMVWSGPYVRPSVYAEMGALDTLMAADLVNHHLTYQT